MTSDDNASISVPAIGLRRALIALVAVAAAAGLWLSGPIYEDPAYHDFADQRALLGVPNAMDVLSNALFLVTGLAGLLVITRHGRRGCTQRWERAAWLTLFAGVTLTGVGSAWYHVAPNNTSLFWDRLPMTIVFASLLSIVLGERVAARLGRRTLVPLLLLGVGSAFAWHLGEVRDPGRGDLRPYALVHYVPFAVLPLMLVLLPPRYTRARDLWLAAIWYGVAKATEALDYEIFAVGQVISGHTLKHAAAAIAPLCFVRHVYRRRPLSWPEGTGRDDD